MTDWVIRKFATDVDEPVLAEPRKGFFVRFMEALRDTRRRQALREIAKHAHILSNDSWQQLVSGKNRKKGKQSEHAASRLKDINVAIMGGKCLSRPQCPLWVKADIDWLPSHVR